MFSLIITIVSIALVVALVAATMYHGGDTLTQGRTTADAAAFVSGGQQIAGAQVMRLSLVGTEAADVATLITDKYLSSAPVIQGSAWVIDTANNLLTSTVTEDAVCIAINKSAGFADATAVDAATVGSQSYGCVNSTRAFQFKY